MSARSLQRRRAADRRFRILGLAAIALLLGILALLLGTILWNGVGGFRRTEVLLPIDLRTALSRDTTARPNDLDLDRPLTEAAVQRFGPNGPALLSDGAWLALRDAIRADPAIVGQRLLLWVPASTLLDRAAKGDGDAAYRAIHRRLAAQQAVRMRYSGFLGGTDSTDPVLAGIGGALRGSILTLAVTIAFAFPVGVMAALYLEEFAPRTRWAAAIEVSINNLAAVPSIIFGLLGLAVFLNLWHLPRSAPLVGGLTLALMTMPIIVLTARNAIRAVPSSIREAALGVGASPVQLVFHHLLPQALPAILTGAILGVARALGETAPLLMIGMRAFVPAPPDGIADPATALPVQIFLWSDEVSRGFVEKTSAAILVLIVVLVVVNGSAILLRDRMERTW